MNKSAQPVLSVVVPVYNEAAGITRFHESLLDVLANLSLKHEILYVDDGSTDGTTSLLAGFHEADPQVRLLRLTRNFGKEIATTAGIHTARGEAILTLDADGQHPVTTIPSFVAQWQQGAKVVVGKRDNRRAPLVKRAGTKLFYGVLRRLMGIDITPDSSDFRLIDRSVQIEFNRMSERNRITRGLIDWLGYERVYIPYKEQTRTDGVPTYTYRKLTKLAFDSIVSLSTSPLYLVAYIGAVVLPVATLLGLVMVVNYLAGDPLHLHATGGAYMMVLILFLVGVLLVSQGIIGLYLARIHTETQDRPLYVVDKESSRQI